MKKSIWLFMFLAGCMQGSMRLPVRMLLAHQPEACPIQSEFLRVENVLEDPRSSPERVLQRAGKYLTYEKGDALKKLLESLSADAGQKISQGKSACRAGNHEESVRLLEEAGKALRKRAAIHEALFKAIGKRQRRESPKTPISY